MKKVLKILLSFVLVFTLLTPITCFAVEVSESEDVTPHTIFTRVWEFVTENKTEVISAVGSGLVIAFNAIIKALNNKSNKKMENSLEQIIGVTAGTAKDQTSIIDVVNKMINGNNVLTEGYEKMRAAYEQYQSLEDDRNRLIGAVMVQNTAIIEILVAVYVHSKNLPQGVKDLVVMVYANIRKALDDDELLKAVVESVREKINFEETAEVSESTEITEAAEV